jgi:TM2 domain-containing membrane protein YozV
MKDKNVAAIFALFFGSLGLHRFYLRQTGLGIFYLVFFWTAIPALISLIDAIVFFSMDKDEFDYKYNRKFIYPDYQRQNTDFDRRERRFREEAEYRQAQRRHREERIAKRRETRPAPKQKSNPYKASGVAKFKEFDYDGAAEDFKKALSIDPKDIAVHFNLACAYSLTEENENAFFHLSKAVEYGFVDFKKIQEHDALAFLRIQDEFDTFKKNGYRLNIEPTQKIETDVTPSNNLLEQIKQLGELREKGLLTEEEFEIQKKKLLR